MSAEILGVLIARVSGMPLSAFMRERIFAPLGMKDSGFTVPEAQLDRVATCYKTDFSSGEVTVLEEARSDLLARPCVFESGAGDQFVSTADDLLAFGRMMLNQGVYGNERILSRLSVELMTTDQLTPEQKTASPFFESFWDSRGWGLGLSIVTRRDDVAGVPGRFGWDGAFSTSLYGIIAGRDVRKARGGPRDRLRRCCWGGLRRDGRRSPTSCSSWWSLA
jgi:CubicO group peptidase (beta-lactamase class C family)